MAGFAIGGIAAPIQKGLAYDVQFSREVVWAIKTGNHDAQAALVKIAETNIKEIVGTAADVTESHAVALLFAHDPFAGSRQLMHDYEAKFSFHK